MNKKFDKIVHSKYFVIVLILIFICLTALLGTYAWFTWSSSNNTTLTMTIGKMADVIFTNGNEINSGLTPVFNYTDGLSTSFNIVNRDTTGSIIGYSVNFNIDTIASELQSGDVRYVLEKNGTIVKEGGLEGAAEGDTITLETTSLSSGTTSYTFYLYIDGNVENDPLMMGKTITGTIIVESDYVIPADIQVTDISNFNYVLGSETSVLSEMEYDGYTIYFEDIALAENEVLLLEYTGTDTNVNVPDTYTIDGTVYNVTLLSLHRYYYYDYDTDEEISVDFGVFFGNDIIEAVVLDDNLKLIYSNFDEDNTDYYITENSAESLFHYCRNLKYVSQIPSSVTDMTNTFYYCISLVNAPEIPSSVTNMSSTFDYCRSLVNAPEIPSSVTSMSSTFQGCTSLVNAPEIPSSVTIMRYTFYGCTSLVNAPVIPNSVTDMTYTFYGCTSLVNAPEIPSSVTSMYSTFQGCTSLVNAPEIPSSVTSMYSTFRGCTNLTGTVRINSTNVSNATYIFHGTSKAITVEVPSGSTTDTKISALTTSNGMPSNVTISRY